MKRIAHLSLLTLSLAVAGCGGGTDSQPLSAAPQPVAATAAPVSPPLAATSAPAPSAAPATGVPAAAPLQSASLADATTCGLPNFRQELLERVNRERAAGRMCGTTFHQAAGPLTWNDKLFNAALGHATDMATNNYFSHVSRDGRTFDVRITNAGYDWAEAGENIAAGQATVAQVMNEWLQSPGHCANIMNPDYSEIGVSCVKSATSAYKQYWAMEFGLPY